MADNIRAAIAIQRPAMEPAAIQDRLHDLIAQFARANLYSESAAAIERLRREIVREVAKKYYPYARAVGLESAKPVLRALGGDSLAEGATKLSGVIKSAQVRFDRSNLVVFRAELERELGTLGGDMEVAFAQAYRDGIARKQLLADMVLSDKAELVQLAKARGRVQAASSKVTIAEKRLSTSGARTISKNRRGVRLAREELTKAKRSVKATKSALARFETKVEAHVRDGMRQETQQAQTNAFREAGYESFTWVAVNGDDACPDCQGRHGESRSWQDWKGDSPGDGQTVCGASCMCQLVPDEYVTDNTSLVDPIKVNV